VVNLLVHYTLDYFSGSALCLGRVAAIDSYGSSSVVQFVLGLFIVHWISEFVRITVLPLVLHASPSISFFKVICMFLPFLFKIKCFVYIWVIF
jgi:hypothetical protein